MTRLAALALVFALLYPSALSAQLRNRAKSAGADLSRLPGGANYGKPTAVVPDASGSLTVEWRAANGELLHEHGKFLYIKSGKARFKLIQRGEIDIPLTHLSPAVRKYAETQAKSAKQKAPEPIR